MKYYCTTGLKFAHYKEKSYVISGPADLAFRQCTVQSAVATIARGTNGIRSAQMSVYRVVIGRGSCERIGLFLKLIDGRLWTVVQFGLPGNTTVLVYTQTHTHTHTHSQTHTKENVMPFFQDYVTTRNSLGLKLEKSAVKCRRLATRAVANPAAHDKQFL
jgi:hypothetical protein